MTSKKPKVFISRIFPDLAVNLLKEAGFTVTAWDKVRPMTREELLAELPHHNALLCASTEKMDVDFLEACQHLDMISQFAVGFDNIDMAKATALKIPIGYTPDVLSQATAEISFGLMIAVARKFFFLHKKIIRGGWDFFKPTADLGIEVDGKTLGIYGMGRIGMEMARMCKAAYNMDIIYHNRTRNPDAETKFNARYVDFDTLITSSDVLSVHCALTPETTGVFDKLVFEKMKNRAIFINTARGLVHNETDLIEALKTGQIWGAGLDVTNPEPMQPDNPLLSMENVAVVPHIGSATVETRDRMARMAAENIIEFYTSGNVPHCVNPEVL